MYRFIPRRSVILYPPQEKSLRQVSQHINYPYSESVYDTVDKLKYAVVTHILEI